MAGKILLLGATGYTGTLTAEALHQAGMPFVAAGRRADRLGRLQETLGFEVETAQVDFESPETLTQAMALDVDAVINCSGPFTQWGEAVVAQALAAGLPYIDCTGEQGFMARCVDRFDADAKAAGVPIVNAFAFEYAPGDWLARRALGEGGADGLKMLYRLDTPLLSRGTYLSMRAQGALGGLAYEGGELVARELASSLVRHQFASQSKRTRLVFVPFGEVVTVPRRVKVGSVETYMSVPPKSGDLSHMKTEEKQADGTPFGPDAAARDASTFGIAAVVERGDAVETWTLEGRDPYGLTAALLTQAVLKLLTEEVQGGVLTPSDVMSPEEGLEYLEEAWGFSITRE